MFVISWLNGSTAEMVPLRFKIDIWQWQTGFTLRQMPLDSLGLRQFCWRSSGLRYQCDEWICLISMNQNKFTQWLSRHQLPEIIKSSKITGVQELLLLKTQHLLNTPFENKMTTISESKCAMQEPKKGLIHCNVCATQTDAVNRSLSIFREDQIKNFVLMHHSGLQNTVFRGLQ